MTQLPSPSSPRKETPSPPQLLRSGTRAMIETTTRVECTRGGTHTRFQGQASESGGEVTVPRDAPHRRENLEGLTVDNEVPFKPTWGGMKSYEVRREEMRCDVEWRDKQVWTDDREKVTRTSSCVSPPPRYASRVALTGKEKGIPRETPPQRENLQ